MSQHPVLKTLVAYSLDPGTVYLAFNKVSIMIDLTDKNRYFGVSLDWAEILNIKYPILPGYLDVADQNAFQEDGTQPVISRGPARTTQEMREAYIKELRDGVLQKICQDYEDQVSKDPHSLLTIVAEPQLDQIKLTGDPIMHDIFVLTYGFFAGRYGTERVKFIIWSGKNKSGLDGVHGRDRKEKTGPVAIQLLQQEGFDDMATYIESLKRPKPQEDVSDAYLAARNFLLNVVSSMGYRIDSQSRIDKDKNKMKRIQGIYNLPPNTQKRANKKRKRKEVETDDDNDSVDDATADKPLPSHYK